MSLIASVATTKTESTYEPKSCFEHYIIPKKRREILKTHRFSAVKRILVRFCFFHPQSTAVIHPLRKHQFSPSAVNRSHENSRSRPSFRSTAVNRSHAPQITEIPQSTAVNPQSTQSMQNLGLAGQDGDCHTATSGSKVANPRSHSVAAPSLKHPRRSRPWMLKPSAWHASYSRLPSVGTASHVYGNFQS